MKKIRIEVSIDESETGEFGNRWINGTTIVMLTPVLPIGGFWNTKRGSDIDSAGGSQNAFYEISYFGNTLSLKTRGYQGDSSPQPHLKLNHFDTKLGTAGGGVFHFRQKEWNVNWQVTGYE